MGIFDYFRADKEVVEKIKDNSIEFSPKFFINEQEVVKQQITSAGNFFKGEVEQDEKKFPVSLGEEHPFDFAVPEGVFKKFGMVTGVVDKYVDFVVGPGFYVKSDDERAKKIIEDFMQEVNFDTLLRAWVKEGLVKGNGFMEIGGGKDDIPRGLKVLNANYIYVKRDKYGVVERYNQYTGAFKRFDQRKVVPFEIYQIAHIGFNKIGDGAYGLGIVYPALSSINYILQSEKDMHMIMNRKANSPYHIKMGGVVGGKYYKPNPADVSKMGKDLEWLNNKHEWTTDGLTDIKVLDFGNIGDKFDSVLRYDMDMLIYTFQVPAVLLGMANIPEGLAQVQMDAFQRRIQSLQAEIEKVVEENIFKRILLANGLDVHVEFEWGQPSDTEKNARLTMLTELMKLPTASQSFLKLVERDAVQLLGYDEDEYEVMSGEEERRREEERQMPIVPGQNENRPQPVKPTEMMREHYAGCGCHTEESLDSYNTLNEWLGFNYEQYKKWILDEVKKDGFDMIKASNTIEQDAGYLTDQQVLDLKKVLYSGFKNGKSMKDMSKLVDKNVKPGNLYKLNEDGKLVINEDGNKVLVKGADSRSIGIIRSEVTRLANQGAEKYYGDNGISKVKWIASTGARTCSECDSLNGRIYELYRHPDIPLHPYCRCTLSAVTEIV
jgi:SPP1 gp7 family putative phage head morphogenesis protein